MYTCIGIVKASLKLLLLGFFLISDEKKSSINMDRQMAG